MVVYGLAAAFGLEFVMASWPALWRGPEQTSSGPLNSARQVR